MSELYLSEAEIIKMTGYARPAYQMRALKSLGIPARKRPDNTVLVMRMDCMRRNAPAANDAPQRKSARR